MRVVIFLVYSVVTIVESFRPEAHTEYGRVRGIEMESIRGRPIYAFLNMPFSHKINYKRRFEELKDAVPWSGVLDAGKTPVRCPEVNLHNKILGVENCLIVNVYTPLLPNTSYSASLYPVVVYIHGGAYYFLSSSDFGPRYLLDNDVILVSINFRMGVIGFASTEDYILPGNLGLKDQVQALQWVQRNIRFFNGDKNSVTLLGMSSGAACSQFLAMSPRSKGLFHQLFIIGGTSINYWSMNQNPRRILQKVALNMNCPSNDSYDMVSCLEQLPAKDIAMSIRTVQSNYFPKTPMTPVVDDYAHNPFIPDYPEVMMYLNKHAIVPIVMSTVFNEGAFFGANYWEDDHFRRELDDNWNEAADVVLELSGRIPPAYLNDSFAKIRQFYFGNKRVQESPDEFYKMSSDRSMLTAIMKMASMISSNNPNLYFYVFDYRGPTTTSKSGSRAPDQFGASHIDDLFYMLNITGTGLESNPHDILMIERMSTLLYNFAATGRPTFGAGVDFEPVLLKTSLFGPLRGLWIKGPDNAEMTNFENLGNVKFWESLPFVTPRKKYRNAL